MTVILFIGLLGFLPQPALAASPQQYDTIVLGKEDPGQDIKAVQEAVDQGGSILLKGAFDFGDKGNVIITKNVKIYGEEGKEGTHLTKILGGFQPFLSARPEELPLEAPGPEVTIRQILFDGALMSAVCLTIPVVRPSPGTRSLIFDRC